MIIIDRSLENEKRSKMIAYSYKKIENSNYPSIKTMENNNASSLIEVFSYIMIFI